jgi:hypothetical protein
MSIGTTHVRGSVTLTSRTSDATRRRPTPLEHPSRRNPTEEASARFHHGLLVRPALSGSTRQC